jgi:anti-sigma-K factor RskA
MTDKTEKVVSTGLKVVRYSILAALAVAVLFVLQAVYFAVIGCKSPGFVRMLVAVLIMVAAEVAVLAVTDRFGVRKLIDKLASKTK